MSLVRSNSSQPDVSTFVVWVCVCVFACMKGKLHVIDGSTLPITVWFWFPQQISVHNCWRKRESIGSISTAPILSGGGMYILISTADVRVEHWKYRHYIHLLLPQFWSLYSLHKAELSNQAVHQLAQQILLFTQWKPSARKCNVFIFLLLLPCLEFTKWLCRWNACWASMTTRQKNMERQGQATIVKFQLIQNEKKKKKKSNML